MTEKFYEKERNRKKEVYLMASRNPWMVWRLQALRAGYVPPLLQGQIPPDLANIPVGFRDEEYRVEPLLEHATRMKAEDRKIFSKIFSIIIIGIILIAALSFTLAFKQKSKYRFGLIDAIIPRTEETRIIEFR